MNPVIIIPTFISARRRKEGSSILATYDHTTPLTQQGELKRCLQSLEQVEGLGQIIVPVVSEPSIENQAVEKVHQIVAQFPDLSITVIGAPEHALIQQRMEQLGIGRMSGEIGLSGYSAVRNLGLVVAHVLGFDAVVFLDDDEVVDDPAFLQKAMYGIGKLTRRGVPILAKTGFYYNSEGSYLSKSMDRWYNHFWQQGKAFNRWIEKAMRGPRLSRSNHVCGGCFALHKEAFKRVAFDPWIPRGEDLDYMLDLRMYGSDIWFDNQWSLHHLPPETPSEGTRFRQDIFRWLYEYRKMEYSRTQIDLMQVKPSSLEPYPGPFLEPGIRKRIRITAFLRSLTRSDKRAYRKAAKAAAGEAASYASRNCAKYFEFQFLWPEIMARLEGDKILTSALLQSSANRQAEAEAMLHRMHMLPDEPPRRSHKQVAGTVHAEGAAAGDGVGALHGERPQRPVRTVAGSNIDPGSTTEIRLNIAD